MKFLSFGQKISLPNGKRSFVNKVKFAPLGQIMEILITAITFLHSKKLHCGVAATSLIQDKLHFYEVKTSLILLYCVLLLVILSFYENLVLKAFQIIQSQGERRDKMLEKVFHFGHFTAV